MTHYDLHLQGYDRKINCKHCDEYTWHKFIKHDPVIITPIRKVLEEWYYLSGLGIYQCLNCHNQVKTPSIRKKILKSEADKLQIPKITDIAFVMQLYK